MSHAPPRLATWLLRTLLPVGLRDELSDELAELHALRCARDGRAAADRWYRRTVLSFGLRMRLAGGVDHDTPAASSLPPRRTVGESMGAFANDITYAWRGLRRNPGFALVAVLTLAIGIGANAAIFSVVRNVLLRPLPFPEPHRLVELRESRVERDITLATFSHANFWDLRDQNRSLESVGGMTWTSLTLVGDDQPVRLSAGEVTAGFFQALRVQPLLGRVFVAGEDEPSANARLVILSYSAWRDRFGADSSVVGKRVTLGGESYDVIGVLPRGTPWLDAADLFVPKLRTPNPDRDSWELVTVARLKPGVSLEAARADLNGVARRLGELYPEDKGMGVTVLPSRDWTAPESLRNALYVLSGAVGLLLLIACVNLANLLLARATNRTRESALRAALGANRGRVVRLALTESALIGGIGAAGGLALAFAIVRLFRTMDPGFIPRLDDAGVDGWVLAVALLAALVTSFGAGLAPALRSPHDDILGALREGERSVAGGGRRQTRLRSALVSVEVALSLMLLVGAGLLVRSFGALLDAERGFQTEQRVFFGVGMPPFATREDYLRVGVMQGQLLERLRALPQVTAVGAVSMPLFQGVGTGMGIAAADQPATTQPPWASWRRINSGYFAALGVPLLAGRDFGPQDGIGAPMRVIISKSVADRLWPGENVLGKTFIAWAGQGQSTAEVIGVAGDMRDWGLAEGPSLAVYLSMEGRTWDVVNFVAHTTLTPEALRAQVRAVLDEFDRTLPLTQVTSVAELVGQSVASRRFTMTLLAALAAIALLLALAGVYGVLSYNVSRRRPEIGVRMALGATARDVMRMILAQGMLPVLIGIAVGIAGAAALSRFMASLLFEVTTFDLLTYLGTALLLAGVAALACWVPARNALRVDVVAALREE